MRIIIEVEGTQPQTQVTIAPSESRQSSNTTEPGPVSSSPVSSTDAGQAPSATGETAPAAASYSSQISLPTGGSVGEHSAGAAPAISGV